MQQDREKWDRRYETGERPHDGPPSQFLRRWLPYLPRGRVLDVATGLGRNALLLAQAGYRVDAVDISPVGLQMAQARAVRHGLRVRWIEADLDTWRPGAGRYAVVVVAFYLNRKLFPRLMAAVKPGGVMVVETHLHRDGPPPRSRYRLRPGDLRRWFAKWEILELEEGTFGDATWAPPRARKGVAQLGRIVAQRPGGRPLKTPCV